MAQINVKLSDELKDFIDAQSGERNMSPSAYVRELIIAQQKRVQNATKTAEIVRSRVLNTSAENNPFVRNKRTKDQSDQ